MAQQPVPRLLAMLVPASFLAAWRDRHSLRGLFANTAWLLTDRVAGLLISVVVAVALVRYLGPGRFGVYQYAAAVAALLTPLAQLGLDSIAVRTLIEEPERRDEILGTVFALLVCSSALLFPVATMAVRLLRPDDAVSWKLVAILMLPVIVQSTNVIDYYFRSRVESKYTVWSTKVALAAAAVATLAFIRARAPVVVFGWAMVIEAVVGASGLILFYERQGQRLRHWTFSASQARVLLRDSWPLLVATLAGTVYSKIAMIMLAQMAGDREVGVFSVAVRVSELWYFIPMAIVVSVFPAIVRARRSDDPSYSGRMQALYDLMAAISYTVTIPLVLVASPLVVFLFGRSYAAAGPILAVHIWAFIFISLGMARNNWLVAENLVRWYMIIAVAGALIDVLLNLWLIPRYGGLGAAWASVAAQVFMVYVSSMFSRRLWPSFRELTLALLLPFRIPSALRGVTQL